MYRYQVEFACKESYDVIVVGAGPAGICAATAAAREGAKTALIERYASLGGMATAGLVAPISEFRSNGELINQGIPWELVMKMEALGGAETDYPIGNIAFDPEIYKIAAQRLVKESDVDMYLLTSFVDCLTEGKHVKGIVCKSMEGLFMLEAKQIVDCTGNAEVAESARMPMLVLDEVRQPASLCFRLGGVQTDKLANIRFKQPHTKYMDQQIREMLLEAAQKEDVPLFGGPWFHTALQDGVVFVNMTRSSVNPENTLAASQMECGLREDVCRFVQLLKEHSEAFRDCYLMETAMQAGYRETRRIHGVHCLTGEELLKGTSFPDTIAKSAHPVDIHIAGSTQQQVQFLEQAGCIPFRCCIAEGYSNLSVAGRCISVDRTAFASIRMQSPVMAIGAAVGKAAAICALQGLPIDKYTVG